MRKIALILGLAVVALAAFAGWQIGSSHVANIELAGDMKDLATQNGARIGLNPPNSDDDFRNAVVGKAAQYGIQLAPEQVTVRHTPDEKWAVYLSTEYERRVNFVVYSLALHYSASSAGK
jgi:hypothetical protein